MAQETAGGVDGRPAVGGARDADTRKARALQGGDEGGAAGNAVFTVVGEQAVADVVAVASFSLADFSSVPVEGEAVGSEVVEEVEFAVGAGLDEPDGHEVCYADVPGGIDGSEFVRFKFDGESA